ncbi:hypothetical protein [Candidatus Nitrosocosmicus arcticus]|nr:hypothetical protein [Candidatus Nitrosocosmicus arcticus]
MLHSRASQLSAADQLKYWNAPSSLCPDIWPTIVSTCLETTNFII